MKYAVKGRRPATDYAAAIIGGIAAIALLLGMYLPAGSFPREFCAQNALA